MIGRICAAAVFACLLFGAAATNTVPNDPNLSLEWDHVAPDSLYSIEIEIYSAEGWQETNRVKQVWWVFDAHPEYPRTVRPLYDHVSALPDGIYWLRARVSNQAEVWSDWGEGIQLVKAWDKPAPPTGCRWTVAVEVKPTPAAAEE